MRPSVAFLISQLGLIGLVTTTVAAFIGHDWLPMIIAKITALTLLYVGYVIIANSLMGKSAKPKAAAVMVICGAALLVSTAVWQLLT